MRKFSSRALFGLIALLVFGSQVCSADTLSEQLGKALPDQQVQDALTLALKNIQNATCQDKKPCAPATDDEIAHPPITVEQAREALAQGAVSALVQFCGLDYRRNYLPVMARFHDQDKLNDRGMAVVALLHGINQSQQLGGYQKAMGMCPDGLRAKLDSELPKL